MPFNPERQQMWQEIDITLVVAALTFRKILRTAQNSSQVRRLIYPVLIRLPTHQKTNVSTKIFPTALSSAFGELVAFHFPFPVDTYGLQKRSSLAKLRLVLLGGARDLRNVISRNHLHLSGREIFTERRDSRKWATQRGRKIIIQNSHCRSRTRHSGGEKRKLI